MPRVLTAEDVQAFRRRICAVAERRFAALGAEGVSMRALAHELGVSATAAYRYFRDKDEILATTRAAAFNRFAQALEDAAAAAHDARERARTVGDAYVRFAFAEPNAYRLMFDMAQPDEQRFPALVAAGRRARATMTHYVESLLADGLIAGDAKTLGTVFWAALHGLIVLHLAGKLPSEPDFTTLRRAASQLLLRGAAPEPSRKPKRQTKRRTPR
jgi:AcrR family transcriptional regulator